MEKLLSPFKQSKILNAIFFSNIFLSLHYFLVYYVNSSFLSNYFSDTQLSALYIIGSAIDTILLINASRILNILGSYKFVLYALTIEFISTIGLIVSSQPILIGFYFLLHLVVISILLFNLDVLVERSSTDESKTGSIRATFLTITNVACVISPALIALLLAQNIFWHVYLLATIALIPLYFLVQKFKHTPQEKLPQINIKETIEEYLKHKDLYNIFTCQFLLQLFYAFMGIYTPLYLEKYIGFSWTEIGILFTIMLLPFVFLELPLGDLEDKTYGEKEFLTIGFVIMGLSTIFISFMTTKVFFIWATILFITRIGASFVEISSETYFFKQVTDTQSNLISFFRISRPLSFIVAPILATVALQFIPFQYIFIIIGILMVLGTHYALLLKDTK